MKAYDRDLLKQVSLQICFLYTSRSYIKHYFKFALNFCVAQQLSNNCTQAVTDYVDYDSVYLSVLYVSLTRISSPNFTYLESSDKNYQRFYGSLTADFQISEWLQPQCKVILWLQFSDWYIYKLYFRSADGHGRGYLKDRVYVRIYGSHYIIAHVYFIILFILPHVVYITTCSFFF